MSSTFVTEDYHLPICTHCYAVRVEPSRRNMPRPTCMPCGEKMAKAVKRTVVPMHKSNYMLITNPDDLVGINNKGGNIK
jgi:PHP family Zn ribbon phosphoesterase